MPIRTVKQYSDRGSIKNLSHEFNPQDNKEISSNIRLSKLIEYSEKNKDQKMQFALGFITTDYISDKNALPLSIYRLRKIVDDIKSKSSKNIALLQNQLAECFEDHLSAEATAYISKSRARVKMASVNKKPIFWRASKS